MTKPLKTVIIVFSILLCSIIGFRIFSDNFHKKISNEDVASVDIWNISSEDKKYILKDEEISEFIELYNRSEKAGRITGEGGTPDLGVTIVLKNKKEICLNQFCGYYGDFESSDGYYLNNSELLELIKIRAEKI